MTRSDRVATFEDQPDLVLAAEHDNKRPRSACSTDIMPNLHYHRLARRTRTRAIGRTLQRKDMVMAFSVKPPFQTRSTAPHLLERLAMAALAAPAAEKPALAHDPAVTSPLPGCLGREVRRLFFLARLCWGCLAPHCESNRYCAACSMQSW